METLIKWAWLALAAVHVMPAAVFVLPGLTEKLYGISPDGDVGILTVHRGALFLAIVLASLFAVFEPGSRRLASLVVAMSVVGFLLIYARAGMPPGSLRTIALVDSVALLPLALVAWSAWRS